VRIPKGDSKTRPVGIPTVKDRVVQTAVAMLLLPVWEADSHPQSYAYRPKRNAHQAMDAIGAALRSGRTEVIDADLSGYFGSIPHRELLRLVARRVSDGRILALIKAWLRAPIVERNPDTGRPTITGNRRGTPQGGVISPLLANLYMNRLDWQVNERCELRPVLVRYADDFVILSRPGQGAELQARLKRWLTAHGLTLNETKTRTLDVRAEGFKFLGFGVSWRRGKSGRNYPHIEPHPKSQMKLRDKVREKLNHWTLWRAAEEVILEVNRMLKGWGGYFLFRGSFDEVHCRCNRTVQSGSCFRVPPRGFLPDPAFGREQSNLTGGTRTRVAPSFTGAHLKTAVGSSTGLGWRGLSEPFERIIGGLSGEQAQEVALGFQLRRSCRQPRPQPFVAAF
jgi:group II intron reverse transcriptase/maturase